MKPSLTLLTLFHAPLLLQAQGHGDEMLAGMAALRQADPLTAERSFSQAIALAPDDGRTWYYRAVARLSMGDAAGAIADLDRMLQLAPNDAHGLIRRSEAHTQSGDLRSATDDLERILNYHPEGPAAEYALLQLGQFAMLDGDLKAAHARYDRLLAMNPAHALALCNRGIVRAAIGRDAEALADLDAAVALDPGLDQAHAHRAFVLLRLDRQPEACAALRMAQALGDRSTEELLLVHCNN